jgi:hypothetical protein
VYGSRFVGSDPRFVHYFWHSAANKFLTSFTNLLLDLNLTDMEVCQKMFRSTLINKIILRENRFGFEPEVTVKLARLGARFYEVGVPYMGRRREEGKKIRWIDGVRALYCLILYSLISKKNWTK